MTSTALQELMKKSNPLMAHRITVLYKLCQQRGRIVDRILQYSIERPEFTKEIERIDNMILEVLNNKKKNE